MINITSMVTTITFPWGETQTIYRCADCQEWFEPACPWDEFCDDCWDKQQAVIVNNLARRENA